MINDDDAAAAAATNLDNTISKFWRNYYEDEEETFIYSILLCGIQILNFILSLG